MWNLSINMIKSKAKLSNVQGLFLQITHKIAFTSVLIHIYRYLVFVFSPRLATISLKTSFTQIEATLIRDSCGCC